MSRVFLLVSSCDDHTSIALDGLTDTEQRLVEGIAEALTLAGAEYGCMPSATVLDTDPDADERDPDVWDDATYPARRPLGVVYGSAPRETEVVDLVAALRASVEAAKKRREQAARGEQL